MKREWMRQQNICKKIERALTIPFHANQSFPPPPLTFVSTSFLIALKKPGSRTSIRPFPFHRWHWHQRARQLLNFPGSKETEKWPCRQFLEFLHLGTPSFSSSDKRGDIFKLNKEFVPLARAALKSVNKIMAGRVYRGHTDNGAYYSIHARTRYERHTLLLVCKLVNPARWHF